MAECRYSITNRGYGTWMHCWVDTVPVMLWAMFCWGTLGPIIPIAQFLTALRYLNFVADQVHPFMTTVFPPGDGRYQQDNAPCHTARIVKEWFKEHDGKFLLMPWTPNSTSPTFVVRLGKVGSHYIITTPRCMESEGPAVDIIIPDTPGDLSLPHWINTSLRGHCYMG